MHAQRRGLASVTACRLLEVVIVTLEDEEYRMRVHHNKVDICDR
jgi:hypothetical protein